MGEGHGAGRRADGGVADGLGNNSERAAVPKGGDIGKVVEATGGTLRAPHMDGDRIREYV